MISSRVDYVGDLGDPYKLWNEKHPERPWSDAYIGFRFGQIHPLDDWRHRLGDRIRDLIPEIAEAKRKKYPTDSLEEIASRVENRALKLLKKEIKAGVENNTKAREYISKLSIIQKQGFLEFHHSITRWNHDWRRIFYNNALAYLEESQAAGNEQKSYLSRLSSIPLYLISLLI